MRRTLGQSEHMYSMDDLLDRVKAERADELRLYVGTPPIIVPRGEHHTVEGPAIAIADAEQLLRSIANTRQRRELSRIHAVES